MARKRTLIFSLLTLIILVGFSTGGYLGYKAWQEKQFLTTPPETPGLDIIFRIEPGQIFTTISANLKTAGLVTNTHRFRKLASSKGKTALIRAGEFKLNTGWTPGRLLHELTSSTGIMKRVSIREGLTWWQTAALIQQAGMGTQDQFTKAIADPAILDEFDIQASNAEGYLFPETYLLTPPRNDQSHTIVRTMLKEFFKNANKVWPRGLPQWHELHTAVILASLVEKETGIPEERARIAGVFHNRIKKRMLIQADPTIIYGLGPSFDGNITKSHLLDRENPYNTYVHRGLPPGPICSPGLESLMAAVHPEHHDFLYFVAKGDGAHHFSKTLKEHNIAVRKYQLERNRKTYRSQPASSTTP
ncbi:endolytic transglycosylase MltG [Pseudodesulfovibrio piezophilus]|uniref:Endolytic murein transglycosylase n=1 Tax=Pseudodesulfovibrio piezophilus (strain DSM 21447 / JCM 15486 / C1TLV30) TaxID=1322246 RepID=M1WRC6_PSEP2|nr:endolytic transglycosylase MltG [Pseudodesulfovibrio piezophilus]CCH48232.1 Aminodeoxychorismate lyase [Pseudodesulfovibrio piezophilus C1TLV30]